MKISFFLKKIILGFALLLWTFLVLEISVRFLWSPFVHSGFAVEGIRLFQHDSRLGWVGVPAISGKRKIFGVEVTVTHNELGFRDVPYVKGDRPELWVLGDSFVWGYQVEQDERFTDRLQSYMSNWQVRNFGISGYGTDQELLVLKEQLKSGSPELVILLFTTLNDFADNSSNLRYQWYYKPYYVQESGKLTLKGVPVRKTRLIEAVHSLPYLNRSRLLQVFARIPYFYLQPAKLLVPDPTFVLLSEVQQVATRAGAKLVIALEGEHAGLEAYLKDQGMLYVLLDNPHRFSSPGGHWTAEGHRVASDKLLDFLDRSRLLTAVAASPSLLRPFKKTDGFRKLSHRDTD